MQHPAHTEQKSCLGKKLLLATAKFSFTSALCLLTALFPTSETRGRMGTSFARSDFWDRLGGQAYLWLVDSTKGNH